MSLADAQLASLYLSLEAWCLCSQVPRLAIDFSYMAEDNMHAQPGPHYWSANSAPFYLRHYMQTSPRMTQRIEEATIVLVDDYCHKLGWISQVDVLQGPEARDQESSCCKLVSKSSQRVRSDFVPPAHAHTLFLLPMRTQAVTSCKGCMRSCAGALMEGSQCTHKRGHREARPLPAGSLQAPHGLASLAGAILASAWMH